MTREPPILVSACLAGVCCRYDGAHKLRQEVRRLVEEGRAVPVCPEELGGLGTPRPRAALEGGGGAEVWEGTARVVTEEGRDVTEAFRAGALKVLQVARETGARRAILKQHSPSCGCGSTGSVQGRIAADGVTAALLRREGVEVEGDEPAEG